jgi:hypothetical protein
MEVHMAGGVLMKTHWWHRLSDDVKTWLATHHGEPLPPEVYDAVIGAGGVPMRHEPAAIGLPDAPLLSEMDWEYCKEAARAENRT